MSAQLDNKGALVPMAQVRSWLRPATIRKVRSDRRVDVRVSFGDSTEALTARVLQLAGYQPAEGDRVLVAGDATTDDDHGCFVIGVVHSAASASAAVTDGGQSPQRLELGDGSYARVQHGELELRDAEDRLLLRYADGSAELTSPAGDLQLSAPFGRVVLKAATDVSIEAARDLVGQAGRSIDLQVEGKLSRFAMHPRGTTLQTPTLDVRARHVELATTTTTVLSRQVAVTADRVVQHVEHYELHAGKLVEKARNSIREVTELAQSTVGRARALVHGLYSLRSGRTLMVSKEETSIDGERILLG